VSTLRDGFRTALAVASAGAGLVHLAHAPDHLAAWAPLGAGFVLAGLLQLLLSLVLLVREDRGWLVVAATGSLLLAGAWGLSRTTGLPFAPGGAEPVGRADLLCVLLELTVAAGALVLLRRATLRSDPGRRTRWGVTAVLTAAVLSTTGAALAAPAHEHPGGPCPARPVASGVDGDRDGADDGVQEYFRCALHEAHAGPHGH
jgi:hypothetical protein